MIFSLKGRLNWRRIWQRFVSVWLIMVCLYSYGAWQSQSAIAGIKDDQYDGNIFILYASNAGLIPPKVNLVTAIQKHIPTLLMFYADDSQECKQNAIVLTQLQAQYKKEINFMPMMVDAIDRQRSYETTDARHYYNGQYVPHFVLVDTTGQVVLDHVGKMSFSELDEPIRPLLGLEPRTEPVVLDKPLFSPSPSADQTFFGEALRIFQEQKQETPN